MADFINTVDVLGEDITINRIIERLITEFKDDNVVTVGNEAFNSCSLLKTVDLPNAISIGTGAFRDSPVESFNAPKVESMGGNVFWGCVFTKAVFPELVSAGDYAFQYARKIVTADFTKLPKIVPSMFSGCNSLKNVFLRNETMCALASTSAFNACFHILGTVQADYNPRGLKDGYIYVPRALLNSYKAATNWSTFASQFRALEDYTVDGTITGKIDLSTSTMLVNRSLTTISNSQVVTIGDSALRDCQLLTTVDLPKAISVGVSAFADCKQLSEIELPNVTSIGNLAFENCNYLTTVKLPKATSIGSSTFANNCSLTSLILSSNTMCTLANTNAFANCYHIHGTVNNPYNKEGLKDGYIYVPNALIEQYKAATNWSTFASQFRAIEDWPEICG